jgi:hypothetical protein
MRFLRSIFGVTLTDKIKSKAIIIQLQEDNVVVLIRHYQEKWRQHVMRMAQIDFHNVPLHISHWESET